MCLSLYKNYIRMYLILLCLFLPKIATSEDILHILSQEESTVDQRRFQFAAQFYGLELKSIKIKSINSKLSVYDILRREKFSSLIISGDIIQQVDVKNLLNSLKYKSNFNNSILIYGDIETIRNKNIQDLKLFNTDTTKNQKDNQSYYKINFFNNMTMELTNQKKYFDLKSVPKSKYYQKISEYYSIIDLYIAEENKKYSLLSTTEINSMKVFLLAGVNNELKVNSEINDWVYKKSTEIELLPILFYFRYSFGDKCWHGTNDYANLTIDDPWLTEPYGNLNFSELLTEMKKVRFHTTMAFVPWNYNRNEEEIINLFRNNQKYYSLCFHGNDHYHREFHFDPSITNQALNEVLKVQEFNIKQAMARMNKLQKLTYLPYDNVMVFPHGISPPQTFKLLKKYNFLATVNSNNIPIGEKSRDKNDRLLSFTTDYENFLSYKRRPPLNPKTLNTKFNIAYQLYLDNPILFYTHQDFFINGIDYFNELAEIVNEIQPRVIWTNLASIIKNGYKERNIGKNYIEILFFPNSIKIKNNSKESFKYLVKKYETYNIPVDYISINDSIKFLNTNQDTIYITLALSSGDSCEVYVKYKNDLNISEIDIEQKGLLVKFARYISDFRDITLSRSLIGSFFVSAYYNLGLYKIGLFMSVLIILFFIILLFFCIRFILKRKYV